MGTPPPDRETWRTLATMWQCSQQHENRDEAKFCGKCGEKHVTPVHCSECGSLLEPDDEFCTSCGHRRDAAPKLAPPTPAVAAVAPVAATPIEKPVPLVKAAAAATPIEAPTPEEPTPEEPQAEEPVTFSFGGMSIAMKDDPSKPDKPKAAKAGGSSSAGARGRGMSPTQSAILSFVLIAAVLGLAFYFVTH